MSAPAVFRDDSLPAATRNPRSGGSSRTKRLNVAGAVILSRRYDSSRAVTPCRSAACAHTVSETEAISPYASWSRAAARTR